MPFYFVSAQTLTLRCCSVAGSPVIKYSVSDHEKTENLYFYKNKTTKKGKI